MGENFISQKELYDTIRKKFPDDKIREGMDIQHRFLEKNVDIKVMFPNGYGASIIRGWFTYGGEDGLFELAVLKWEDSDMIEYELVYYTPITNDVLPSLNQKEVIDALEEIRGLNKDGL